MRDFLRSPLFRCLVCLILVCCILVNVSPIRAKAFAGLSASALLYLLYAAAVGVVIIPPSIEIANAIGKKVDEDIEIRVAPELWDTWINLRDRMDNLVPEWDPDEWYDDLKHGLAGGLLAAISGMMIDLVLQGAIDVVGDSAEDGYLYYGDYYLPEFTDEMLSYKEDGYRTNFIRLVGNYYFFTMVNADPIIEDSRTLKFNAPVAVAHFKCNTSSPVEWSFDSSSTHSSGWIGPYTDLLWCNVFDGEPSDTYTITIEPDIYVGDLPDQIKSGEKDEENLNLPIIDPFKIIQSPETAYEDVTQTLQDLKDGVITYDEYIERVTDDEPVVDPSEPSDPTDPTEDPEAIPEDMAPYIFDLREIFPFCIPFDLYDFLTCLNASPVAPVIHWEIQLPGGGSYPLDLDLSPFDSVAQLLRRLQLLAFCIALGIKTRDLIKG